MSSPTSPSLVGIGLCWLLSAPALADDCDALVARLVAGVRGTTFVGRGIAPHNIDLKHPSAAEFWVKCRLADDLPEQVHIGWYDNFPPAAYFDLVGSAGSIVTSTRPDAVRRMAMRCHQRLLSDPQAEREMTAGGITYICDIDPYATVTVFKTPKP